VPIQRADRQYGCFGEKSARTDDGELRRTHCSYPLRSDRFVVAALIRGLNKPTSALVAFALPRLRVQITPGVAVLMLGAVARFILFALRQAETEPPLREIEEWYASASSPVDTCSGDGSYIRR